MTLPAEGVPVPPQASLLQQARTLLAQQGLRPRKRLGQNFLIDKGVLRASVEAGELVANDVVVEVGPGLGFLTRELASRAGRVVAVELDSQMGAILKRTLAEYANVTVVQGDILALAPRDLLAPAADAPVPAYKVIANLPYYITSPVLRHFLEAEAKPRLMVVMVQKEVAERLAAGPPDMSLLSIGVQIYGRPRIVRLVSAGAFYPPPAVGSAIVRIDVYDRPAVDVDDVDHFFKLVAAGFSQPRKQLHNTLAQRLWFPPGGAKVLLERAGIDPRRRPATLSLAEWERLYHEWTR